VDILGKTKRNIIHTKNMLYTMVVRNYVSSVKVVRLEKLGKLKEMKEIAALRENKGD